MLIYTIDKLNIFLYNGLAVDNRVREGDYRFLVLCFVVLFLWCLFCSLKT